MGGHGGLNILPQKRWNVYNFDNREKVKNDEEAAAKEEQLKREQTRKRDAEYRLEQLRTARGLAPTIPASAASAPAPAPAPAPSVSESRHINLFEGIKVFDILKGAEEGEKGVETDGHKKKKMKKEEPAPRVVTEEDETYRLGYGVAGKGVKLPWYLAKPSDGRSDGSAGDNNTSRSGKDGSKSSGKKTIEELREERLRREKREKERTRALIHDKGHRDVPMAKDRYFSRRCWHCGKHLKLMVHQIKKLREHVSHNYKMARKIGWFWWDITCTSDKQGKEARGQETKGRTRI